MKIAYIGNTCNNSYSFLKSFRTNGLEGTLFYDTSLHPQTFPESEDSHLKHSKPDWIRPMSPKDLGMHPWRGATPHILNEIAAHDVIHCEDVGLIWAQQSGKPYIWFPYGTDIQHYPFWSYWINCHSLAVLRKRPELLTAPIRFRKAIQNAAFIQAGQWILARKKTHHLLAKLLPPDRFMRLFLTLDTEKYCPGPAPSIAEQLIQEGIHTPVRGLTIFHPTRIMFTSKTDYDYGSDVLLRALKRFHDAGHDFTFIVVRKGTPDEPDFENIIAKTEFADRVIWIPFQTREKLIHWYRACDLVTSEFGFGGFGSISLEAMACGAPLMTAFRTEYPDPTFFLPSFDSLPPTYPANSEDQAAEQLLLWATDRRLRERKRLEGREWVIRNSSPAALAPKFLDAYQRAIQTHPVSPLPITYPEPTAIHFRTIALHLRRKDFTGALGAIATALDDSPEHPVLLGALADTFYAMGERGLHFALRQELNLLGIEIRR